MAEGAVAFGQVFAPSGSQFANRLDDFRNGGQGISSQLSAGGQPQPSNIEEFPPLGRNAAAELPLGANCEPEGNMSSCDG
jgi:hypothetical protein